jgi:hypothetical protein
MAIFLLSLKGLLIAAVGYAACILGMHISLSVLAHAH